MLEAGEILQSIHSQIERKKIMDRLEKFLNKFLGPLANFMNNSLFFSSLSEAFMRITPITLGGAVVLLIGNFPIPSWIQFLDKIGWAQHFNAAQNATMNAIALFIVFNFAYVYAKKAKYEGLSAGLLAVACFLILMPQNYLIPQVTSQSQHFPVETTLTGVKQLTSFATEYTGATGIIVAIFVGWFCALQYVYFNKKNLVIKLPQSVPPNVSESLRPSILSGIILLVFLAIRMLFAFAPFLSSFGNVFTFINTLIQTPLQHFVSSPISLIIIYVLANILWFFGIHPNMIYGIISPILLSTNIENQNAFKAGHPLPYLTMAVIAFSVGNAFGGQGTTIGLIIAMIRAKSTRYKELFKLAVIPSLFNINEPLVFGMPIMMNPIFFIPMLLTPIAIGGGTLALLKILSFTEFNPMLSLPWTTPGLIVTLLQGGVKFFIIGLFILVVSTIIWTPFFRIADNAALLEEKNRE
ncbi:PTS sugar transporter subunit IIC [Vagococcus entomophilus]